MEDYGGQVLRMYFYGGVQLPCSIVSCFARPVPVQFRISFRGWGEKRVWHAFLPIGPGYRDVVAAEHMGVVVWFDCDFFCMLAQQSVEAVLQVSFLTPVTCGRRSAVFLSCWSDGEVKAASDDLSLNAFPPPLALSLAWYRLTNPLPILPSLRCRFSSGCVRAEAVPDVLSGLAALLEHIVARGKRV